MMLLDYTLKHFSVSSSLVFCVNSVQKMYSNAMKTPILRAHIFSQVYLNIMLSIFLRSIPSV